MTHVAHPATLPGAAIENKTYYRPDIDGLRGIAVGLVILYHVFPRAFANGYLGVDVFFVISGFVVTQALRRNLALGYRQGLLEFYSRRIKRILPALYANLIITIVLSCLFIPPSDLQSIFKTAAAAASGVSNLALMYARFDYFSPDLALNPFVQTWSLGVEEQFYFVFPSVLMLCARLSTTSPRFSSRRLLTGIAVGSAMYWLYLRFNAPVAAFYNPFARFWQLLTGVVLALNTQESVQHDGGKRGTRLATLAASCFVLALALTAQDARVGVLATSLVVLGSAAIVAVGPDSSAWLSGILRSRPLVWVGEVSYSLYLWHYCIFTFLRWNLGGEGLSNAVFGLPLTFAVSYLSYRFVELPLRYASWKGVRVVYGGMASASAVLLVLFALYRLPPSKMYLGDSATYADLWPPQDAQVVTTLSASQRECHLQYGDRLSAQLFARCSTQGDGTNEIYLVGNSHAQHLIPMVDSAARALGHEYSAVTISNCRLISAYQYIRSISYRYDLCKDYYEAVVAHVVKNAKPGDLVLIGARSLFEPPVATREDAPSDVFAEGRRLSAREAYEKSLADITSFAATLYAKDVLLVFAGPTPEFELPATQCAPEWFRSVAAGCDVDAQRVAREMRTYLESIATIRSMSENGYLWDPASVLCSESLCAMSKEGRLLFRDRHHLTMYGSALLAPSFIRFVDSIRTQGIARRTVYGGE